MASGGDDDDGLSARDPFVLLGIPAGSDEREIRKAYARLIKRYRPDRAPEQFQKIQAAYERALVMRVWFAHGAEPRSVDDEWESDDADDGHDAAADHEDDADEAIAVSVANAANDGSGEKASSAVDDAGATAGDARARSPNDPRQNDLESRRAARRREQEAAAARRDGIAKQLEVAMHARSVDRDRIIGELLDARAPVAQISRSVDLAGSRAVTWTRLVHTARREDAFEMWSAAFQRAFEVGDAARAVRLLDDEQLRHDVTEDTYLARAVIDRLTALEWLAPLPQGLLAGYAKRLAEEGAEASSIYLDIARLEMTLACLARTTPLPEAFLELPRLTIAVRIGTDTQIERSARQLRGALAAVGLPSIDAFAPVHWLVADGISDVLHALLPYARTRLHELPRELFDRLTHAAIAVGKRPPRRWLAPLAGASSVAGIGLGVAGTLGVLATAGAYGLATEKRRYRDQIRPAIARVALDVGVPIGVIVAWIRANPSLSGRLRWFDLMIAKDRELALFGVAAAVAAALS